LIVVLRRDQLGLQIPERVVGTVYL
jgi:hypothetical protein